MTSGVWAAVPVKEFPGAKQRLAALLTSQQRQALAAAMLEDVLSALVEAPLAGIMVNTLDPLAAELARRYGGRVVTVVRATAIPARLPPWHASSRKRPGSHADRARRHPTRYAGGNRRVIEARRPAPR